MRLALLALFALTSATALAGPPEKAAPAECAKGKTVIECISKDGHAGAELKACGEADFISFHTAGPDGKAVQHPAESVQQSKGPKNAKGTHATVYTAKGATLTVEWFEGSKTEGVPARLAPTGQKAIDFLCRLVK
jgi:hypothetical protein